MVEAQDNATLLFNWMQECERENIILSFKGDFNQELVNAILLLAEREPDAKMNDIVTRARVFSIMVECMQNIRKYGAVNSEGTELKPGLVLVCRHENGYSLKTGNLITDNEVPALKEKLEIVKTMSKGDLKSLHKKVLSETHLSDKSGAGLGLISITRKCDSIDYAFKKLDGNTSFYTLDIYISNNKTA